MFSICDIILFRFYAHTVKEIWYNAHMAEFRFHDRFVLVFLHSMAYARFDAVLGHLRSGRRRLEFIASSCGFSSATYLAASFKRRYGMSTRQWCRANCGEKPGA